MKNIKELITNFNKKPSEQNFNKLMNEILISRFYVASYDDKEAKEVLLMTEDQEGNLYYPIFSDLEELKKWNGDFKTIICTFPEFINIISKDKMTNGVVINPFGDSFNLLPEFIRNYIEIIKKEKQDDSND